MDFPVSSRLRRELLKAFHVKQESEDGFDEFNSILLQLSLALMLIFMIAFFLFMSKVDMDLSQIDTLKKQVSESEQAKLLHAVEQVAERYRIQYGLKEFMFVDPVTGEKSFEFTNVIENGVLARTGTAQRSFLAGAAAARRDYDDTSALEQAWVKQVRILAGVSGNQQNSRIQDLVRDHVLRVRREVVEVQTLAAAAVQEFFVQHPEQVNDGLIRQLLAQINQTPDSPEREAQLKELSLRLKQYVYDYLAARSGVRMLEALP